MSSILLALVLSGQWVKTPTLGYKTPEVAKPKGCICRRVTAVYGGRSSSAGIMLGAELSTRCPIHGAEAKRTLQILKTKPKNL